MAYVSVMLLYLGLNEFEFWRHFSWDTVLCITDFIKSRSEVECWSFPLL